MIPRGWGARNERQMTDGPIHSQRVEPQVAVVAIGGFDPSGGAGVVRDFLTARTLGAAVRLIPTAWTEQSQAGVAAIEPRDPDAWALAVRGALANAVRSAGKPAHEETRVAVKVGMLPNAQAARALWDALRGFAGPVVLDPVLRASSGGELYSGDPAELLAVGARATLITPNAAEAAALSGLPVRTTEDAVAAGRALCLRGVAAVLVKGGHLAGSAAVDVLVTAGEIRQFSAARLPGPPVRGTGCALATAIAVGLGRGLALGDAIAAAKAWLLAALAGAVDVGGERHLS